MNNKDELLLKKRVIAQLDPEKLDKLQGGTGGWITGEIFGTCFTFCYSYCKTDDTGHAC